mgnify:CR=1 FL=1
MKIGYKGLSADMTATKSYLQKKETFEIRKDRFQFQRLSRKYTDEQMLDFLVANFLEGVTISAFMVSSAFIV